MVDGSLRVTEHLLYITYFTFYSYFTQKPKLNEWF